MRLNVSGFLRHKATEIDSRGLGFGSTVHIVEVGGRGGVYHHSKAIAAALQREGVPVVLHTAVDCEQTPTEVPTCHCMKWVRRAPNGLRQVMTTTGYLTRTLPHLRRSVKVDDMVHIQGTFGGPLTLAMFMTLRLHPIAFTPHNSFARSGRKHQHAILRNMVRRAAVVFALVDSDVGIFSSWGATVARQGLVLDLPAVSPEQLAEWKRRFSPGPTALLAGQVRPDKRPEMFAEACAIAGVRAAVVGPDSGAESALNEAVQRHGTELVRYGGYLPLEDFVAAILASDVVVASHSQGSGSGPLAFASELGCKSVAFAVGGLSEMVTRVAPEETAHSLAEAIRAALKDAQPVKSEWAAEAGRDVLRGYSLTGWVPPAGPTQSELVVRSQDPCHP